MRLTYKQDEYKCYKCKHVRRVTLDKVHHVPYCSHESKGTNWTRHNPLPYKVLHNEGAYYSFAVINGNPNNCPLQEKHMVYTQEQLNSMTNHEINLAVARKYFNDGRDVYEVEILPGLNVVRVSLDTPGVICASLGDGVFDPCSNWNDVMPIAEKYRVALLWGSSCASLGDVNTFGGSYEAHVNMKRAICGVFLMTDIEQPDPKELK